MKAAVYYGPNKVDVTDVPEPDPGPGTVKVQVGFNGICGTDLHEYYAGPIFVPTEPHPLTGAQLPIVMGHEFSGTITALGEGVTGWAEGDRVAIEPIYRCGRCGPCRAGTYNICAQIGFHGLMSDGGMAEYTVVPTDMLHKLPDNVSLELGALVEPMSVAYHAATLGDPDPDRTAMVFGAGPIGIGLWFALRGKGIEDVFVVEPSATRRSAIEALGARTLDPTALDVPAFIADHTDGRGAGARRNFIDRLVCKACRGAEFNVDVMVWLIVQPRWVCRSGRSSTCICVSPWRIPQSSACGWADTQRWLRADNCAFRWVSSAMRSSTCRI